MIEPDPIDAQAAASRISVAQLDPPDRGRVFSNIFERLLLGPLMVTDAALLPLAIEPDVKHAWVGNRRSALRWPSEGRSENCEKIRNGRHGTS